MAWFERRGEAQRQMGRKKIKEAGLMCLRAPTAICPITVGRHGEGDDDKRPGTGRLVIGFGHPVVPEGHGGCGARFRARIRTADIDAPVGA